jgi:hypothetical protein
MANPYHDSKTGEFSSGSSGHNAGAGNRRVAAHISAQAKKPGSHSGLLSRAGRAYLGVTRAKKNIVGGVAATLVEHPVEAAIAIHVGTRAAKGIGSVSHAVGKYMVARAKAHAKKGHGRR